MSAKVVECWCVRFPDGSLLTFHPHGAIAAIETEKVAKELARRPVKDDEIERYFLVPAAEWERVNRELGHYEAEHYNRQIGGE